jgi:nitroreductase
MDAVKAIKTRRSVRSYDPAPVPHAVLKRVLEAGRMAPSACNIQPWCFIVVEEQSVREAISHTGRYASFLAESPAVIVGCGNKKISPKWHVVDVTIALENMVIAATAEGLGTCWIGSFNESKVNELLKIPDGYKVVALLAVGYPKQAPSKTSAQNRKRLEEIVMHEEFGKPFK